MRIRGLRRRGRSYGRTVWERIVEDEARRFAARDRVELEAIEAEVLEHGVPVGLPGSPGRGGAGLRERLARVLGRRRRRG